MHLVLFSADRNFNPQQLHQQNKIIVLVNNSMHAGQPDGIDARMLFIGDTAAGKIKAPNNIVFAVKEKSLING